MLTAAVIVYWWFTASAFDRRLSALNGHELTPGVRLHFASKQVAGFPFRLDAVMDGLTIEVATRYGPVEWRAEHFAMHALTYGRSQQIFEAAGSQSLSWTDAEAVHHEFAFLPGSLRASAVGSHEGLIRFDLDVIGIASGDITGGRSQFHLRRDPTTDALDFIFSADALHLAPHLQSGFGDTIRHLQIEGTLSPARPFVPFLAGQSDWRDAVDKWRLRTGILDLQKIDMAWSTLGATGSGKLSLNDAHRFQGQLDLKVHGAATLPRVNSDRTPASEGWLAFALAAAAQKLPSDAASELSVTLTTRSDGGFTFAADTDNKSIHPAFTMQSPEVVLDPLY